MTAEVQARPHIQNSTGQGRTNLFGAVLGVLLTLRRWGSRVDSFLCHPGCPSSRSRHWHRVRAHMPRLDALHPSSPWFVPLPVPPTTLTPNPHFSNTEFPLVFPTLGIQLETHRGQPLLPTLSTTYHFIPLSALQDVVIHGDFRRRDVRYYFATLKRTRRSPCVYEAYYVARGARARCEALALASASCGVEVRVAFEVHPTHHPLVPQR